MWLMILECAVAMGRKRGAGLGGGPSQSVFASVFYVRFVSRQQLAARVPMTRLSTLLSMKSDSFG